MKNIFFICGLALSMNVSGQFNFPTEPERIYPAMNLNIGMASQSSCFNVKVIDYYSSGEQNLYVYAWDANDVGHIAFRRSDPTNAITYDENHLLVPTRAKNVEVAITEDDQNGKKYVIAAYYSSELISPGHYVSVYEFTPTGLVIEPGYPLQISNSATYGRISVDVHRTSEVAVVWRDNQTNSIRVKIGISNLGVTFIPSVTIINTGNGISPDAAIACSSNPNYSGTAVRMVYYDSTLDQIIVSSATLDQIMNAAFSTTNINFITDDINVPTSTDFLPETISIDCPDEAAQDNWSYIYMDGSSSVSARVCSYLGSASPTITTYALDGGLFGPQALTNTKEFTTGIAYNSQNSSIYYGWFYGDINPGDPNVPSSSASGWHVAVNLKLDGSPSTPEYQCVTDPLLLGSGPGLNIYNSPIAFSKRTQNNDYLFAIYPLRDMLSDNRYIATKLIPWSQNNFKQNPTNVHEHHMVKKTIVMVAPNPFTNSLSICIAEDNKNEIYALEFSDISGKNLLVDKGNLTSLNVSINKVVSSLFPGIYLLNIRSSSISNVLRIIKQ